MAIEIISSQTELVLELSLIKRVGPKKLRQIFSSPPQFLFDISVEELLAEVKIYPSKEELSWAHKEAQFQIDQAMKFEAKIISALDDEYPRLLKQSDYDPFLLFVKGKLSETPENSVAIIGTRQPTEHSKIIDERITAFFVKQGWSIVSGLALGCDSIAHQTAVNLNGHTVAVLAHGLHTIAPKENIGLANEILESGGALVSTYPFDTAPAPFLFAARDKIQTAMAKGVIMIASDIQGGSLIASRASIQSGRVLAVPYPTKDDRLKEEPKVQANLILADDDWSDKAELLECSKKPELLDQLFIIRNKDDYPVLLEKLQRS